MRLWSSILSWIGNSRFRYALGYMSELHDDTPYSTRLFGEPLTVLRSGANGKLTVTATLDGEEYACADHQDLMWVWRGDPSQVLNALPRLAVLARR